VVTCGGVQDYRLEDFVPSVTQIWECTTDKTDLMFKQMITPDAHPDSGVARTWLDLQSLAQVELTSEGPAYPIESALMSDKGSVWCAAIAGEQTVRLLFRAPLKLRRIRLVFEEAENARTQEFVLRWSPDGGQSYQDIARQLYYFSPPVTRREMEDFAVDLRGDGARTEDYS
jgi:hypothetical protein